MRALEDFGRLATVGACMPASRRPRRSHTLPVLLIATAVWAFVAGCATRPQARVSLEQFPAAQRSRAGHNISIFNKVWDLVNRKHYKPNTNGVDWQKAAAIFGPRAAAAPDDATLYATLNEMLAPLQDSHTRALTPDEAKERLTRERARTGFSLARVENVWVVTDVVPDSPAGAAGVTPGWIVVSRNGVPLGPQPDFRAREGEEVHWVFLDPHDEPREITVRAKRLSIAPLQAVRELPGGFVYLRFDAFDTTNRRWLSRQLEEHARAPGVVIDLRRNAGGGVFSLGVSIGEFFNRSVEYGTFVTRGGARKAKSSWQLGSARYAGNVVVLIDSASASAAEIFAAVLQDHKRAVIVGRTTAGAVLASWFYRLPDGGELQLSREDYTAPKGRRIERVGVEPDVLVTRSLADVRFDRDVDLETALAILRTEQPRAVGSALRADLGSRSRKRQIQNEE